MKAELTSQLIELQKNFVSDILTLAEIGLPAHQFKPYKKQIFTLFHNFLKPETIRLTRKEGQSLEFNCDN